MRIPWFLPVLAVLVVASDDNDTLWGAYRPNLYFGMRPQIPQSLMTGLIWFGAHDYQSVSRARHACSQDDQLRSYTWNIYDPREGGVQTIEDPLNNVRLTTEFIKVRGGGNGGSWAARVKGEPIDPAAISRPSLIWYLGLEGLGGLDMDTDEEEDGLDGEVKFSGSTPELDEFTIRIVDGPDNTYITEGPHASSFSARAGKTHYLGQPIPTGHIWQARDSILQTMIKRAQDVIAPYADPAVGLPDPSFILQLPDEVYSGSTLYAIQKTFTGPFQFDVFFDSASATQKLTSAVLDQGIPSLTKSYASRFSRTFPIPSSYPPTPELEAFSQDITASLIGGVGYFHGTSIIDRSFSFEWDEDDEISDDDIPLEQRGPQLTQPKSLLTATPSRSFFPRGFYWDEGFHLLHIGQWDDGLALEILKSWIDLIDEDGWVGREQILGEEARSKVPPEFQTQYPKYANPPTLTMAVTAYIRRVKAADSGPSLADLGMDTQQTPLDIQGDHTPEARTPAFALSFLKSIYKPLRRHYDWFRRTQRGLIKPYARLARSRTEAYRWRGRNLNHVLTSGMDDYPRSAPHAGELHLDLISWMGFFTRTMKEIAEFVGETDDALSFGEIYENIVGNIDDLHWDEEEGMYCDASVDDEDESMHVCHRGYLSLFPFLLELVSVDSPHLGRILDLVRDPEHLWSPYGLRSLSVSHPEFGQGENYWKGPIWVQMNFLALRALHQTYAAQEGPYQAQARKIYEELRRNVVDNIFKEYQRTGYVWEQYDALTGEGRRSHPFTGWTSLVTLILSEKY
ncbi:glycoside hydrolase [Armillaria mellea]|nr:glycoside hydrolase [Armillaria mellea]